MKIDENRKEITNTISYILQFIDSATFMTRSLSNLGNDLAAKIHKVKRKNEDNNQ